MASSWRQLHYLQRPAKNVERRMIAEMLLRLDRLRPLDEWRYVGLGSVYFADFALFHRVVGFPSMLSIEIAETPANRERFEFNKPFGCVDVEWGSAADVLSSMAWDRPTVVWLDYDGKLDDSTLADVGAVVTRCASPTFLVVSVNVESSGPNADVLKEFVDGVTPERVPAGTVEGDVGGWGLAGLAYRVLAAAVAEAISDRNGVVDDPAEHVQWHQLLHFRYADGARMLTVGGLLTTAGDHDAVGTVDLDGLFFAKTGSEPYDIRIPNITNREILHLSSQMPGDPETIHHHGIPPKERREFAEAYRYFPAYLAVDL